MHTHYRLPINSILERKSVWGVRAPGQDYGQRSVSAGEKWQSHIEFKSMLINQACTFTDNRHWQQWEPIPIPPVWPCVWGQQKGEVSNLGARRFPSRLRAMLRKSLHSAVPPSHCWRTTSHCTLITEYLNTYTQTHRYSVSHSHKPSRNSAAWWSEQLSCNWTHCGPCVLVSLSMAPNALLLIVSLW